ncbi:MAG: VWA domain-containing protein, partial [Erythrobacter sp.]
MTPWAEGPGEGDPLDSALLAARLFASSPLRFGGMVLRGGSPARDALVEALGSVLPCRRLPGHVDEARLDGGIDIAASLSARRPVAVPGLLAEAAGGVLIVPMAERLDEGIAGRLAQALDERQVALVLLDDGMDEDDRPPDPLLDRIAFHCDLAVSRVQNLLDPALLAPAEGEAEPLDDPLLESLAATAAAFGVFSARPLLFAMYAARAHAALNQRREATSDDIEAALRLVIAPRATQLPPPPEQPAPQEAEPPEPSEAKGDDADSEGSEGTPEDQMVEATAAAIPADLLAQLAEGRAPRRASGSGSGRKRTGLRGKPLGARPGMPRDGARLALIDTLRAAVPWQALRRREEGETRTDAPIIMRKSDLRVRRFEERAARVTIFAVDASGSSAAARLAEAKGAVELMLSQAYVTRSQVALIAFRGTGAELLLPPTRSLTRARRALSELPGGGGTPLA